MKKIAVIIVLVLGALTGFSYVYAQNFLDTKPTMQFSVPKSFGLLVTILPGVGGTHFWFEAEDGTLRRVIMDADGNFITDVWAITRQ
jgi:hypothetical protein